MTKNHPVRRAIVVLRMWIVLMAGVMVWNAIVAMPVLLTGWMRPLPFLFLAVVALVWLAFIWVIPVVIWCASLITVGVALRSLEVLLFAEKLNTRARLTGFSLWVAIGGTAVAFGILNVLAASRRSAEEWVWKSQH